jgi:hypothetical protein
LTDTDAQERVEKSGVIGYNIICMDRNYDGKVDDTDYYLISEAS